jgi:hypothetical protein
MKRFPQAVYCVIGRRGYISIIFPVPTILHRRFVPLISVSEPQSGTLIEKSYVDEIMCCV